MEKDDASKTAAVSQRLVHRIEPIHLALLVAAASFLASQYSFLDRRDRGLWWGDGDYNLLRSYYVLKGYKLYDDIASGQLPGLQTLYAFFLWPLGFGRVRPSPETFAAIEPASLFITGALQGFIFYLAFRTARAAASLSLVLSIFIAYVLWERHGHYYPLVETILVPTAALMVCLLALIFLGNHVERLRAALYLWPLLAFGGILGLTMAPTVVFWSIVSTAIAAPVLFRECAGLRELSFRERIATFGGWRLFLPVAACAAFLVWTFTSMGFRSVIYWTVVNPAEATKTNVWQNVVRTLTRLPQGWFHFSPGNATADVVYFPHWALPQFAMLLLAIYVALRYQRSAGQFNSNGARSRAVLGLIGFSVSIVIGYLLMGWRYPGLLFDHKKVTELGVSIGLFALTVGLLAPAKDSAGMLASSSARAIDRGLAFRWVVCVLICVAAAWPYRAPARTGPRPEPFDVAGVCRLGEVGTNCDCILQASYDPRRFLEYDVQPCLGYSPEQPNMLQQSRRSREQFEAAIDNEHVAFFMGDTKKSVTIWDISEQSYDKIVSSRTCIPLYGVFRICYAPSRDHPNAQEQTH